MLTTAEVETALTLGYETRGFEIKGPGGSDDKHLLVKVARAALSMGNLRDGGHVVIGIDDNDPAAMLPGLDASQLQSWLDYDTVSVRLAEYADPPLKFDLARCDLSSGVQVALIQVHEFTDIPHLCGRAYESALRMGALYVRSRKKPETAEVASSVEMREVLDLAAEKRLRAYVETAERAGVHIELQRGEQVEDTSSREKFESQKRGAWE